MVCGSECTECRLKLCHIIATTYTRPGLGVVGMSPQPSSSSSGRHKGVSRAAEKQSVMGLLQVEDVWNTWAMRSVMTKLLTIFLKLSPDTHIFQCQLLMFLWLGVLLLPCSFRLYLEYHVNYLCCICLILFKSIKISFVLRSAVSPQETMNHQRKYHRQSQSTTKIIKIQPLLLVNIWTKFKLTHT